jgi:AcrR family transcriptional regulator
LSATVKTVATLAGVSEGVIFQRFGTKARLIEAALAPGPAPETVGPETRHGDPGKAFEDLVAALFADVRKNGPSALPLLHRSAAPASPLTSPDGVFARNWRALERHLDAELAHGGGAAKHAAPAAFLMAAALHHAALFEAVGGPSPHVNEQAVRKMARALWAGLAPRQA